MMADQEDEPAATDLELPTDSSSEAESDSSSEAAPPSQARCTESSDSDDNDEMPSLEDDRGTIAPAARADMAPEEPETVLEDNETARAPAPVNDEDANPTKEAKCVEAISAAAANLVCPIAQALPTDPVTAEDGHIYERGAIESWFRAKDGDPTSPITGARMGTRLLEAHQVRNTIEALVKSGAVDSELATAWRQKLKDETWVKETRAKAEVGDGGAMCLLGAWYGSGMKGLAKDLVQSRAWYERSAAARNPKGLGSFAECLLTGAGGSQDITLGLVIVTQAAELGSDFGAYALSEAFFFGNYGLQKNSAQARFWLKKVVDGECKFKNLHKDHVALAANMLTVMDAPRQSRDV
uniref:U-box domain-containing protein n=1 Tax=Pelagomonas calceolata TaxID=35677 RepID=A0A7S4E7L0_9STRA